MDISLQPGATKINARTLFYIPPNCGKHTFDYGAMNIDKIVAAIAPR
jgi:hypothetical protein